MSNTEGTSPNNGDTLSLDAPTDQWGDTHQDLDLYPEGSAARSGTVTAPSGQGGATPHDGVSYQDRWPANPEPSATSKAWGEYLDAKARAEREGTDPPEPPDPATMGQEPAPAPKTTTKTSAATSP